ncbi:TerB family tellurite resistance protein [Faunimonas pinastri]|nr:TerB family tellurite resistance protein [Faunimonas pinastri]
MGLLSRLGDLISGSAAAVGNAVAGMRGLVAGLSSRDTRKQVAFTIAMVALSAKMAKADGVVSPPEIDAFCRIFTIPLGEERNVSRVYNLAKSDIAGFESYARDVRELFPDDPTMLEEIVDGLFHIAKADGAVHERELAFLARVAELFGFSAEEFARISARHIGGETDPYLILGADRTWDNATLKRHYRRLVVENHPDRLVGHGLPQEFIKIATDRLAAINAAWDDVARQRKIA